MLPFNGLDGFSRTYDVCIDNAFDDSTAFLGPVQMTSCGSADLSLVAGFKARAGDCSKLLTVSFFAWFLDRKSVV